MKYWLVKSDPEKYSWDDFERDNSTIWDGVRNYQARNNLNEMEMYDLVLVYHSQTSKDIVGIAKVSKPAFQDPTSEDPRWLSVELTVVKKLDKTIKLSQMKEDELLKNISLIKQSRLSVMPLSKEEFDRIIDLSIE